MSEKNVSQAEEKALPRVRPATDILEREDGYHVFMDMPGVAKEALGIDLSESELTVTGRTAPLGGEGEKYVEVQFGACEYRRTITVSDMVDRERIKANLKDGVLELVLPKAEKLLPRRIEIRSA
ncbi:MAG: Hsp20/alpha crystallin family protein [Desulfovibrionaceae bacterium]